MAESAEAAASPEVPPLDFRGFHERELPGRLAAGNGALAAASIGRAGSLGFRLPDGSAYTYLPQDGGVEVRAGDEQAETLIELDADSWAGLAQEFESVPALVYGKKIRCLRGNAMTLMRWDPALRAMYGGRPYFDPNQVDLRDRNGAPLEVERSFRLDDDPEEMSHFLRSAGFLLVRGVFEADEVARFLRDAERLEAGAVPGDKQSWWGRNAAGEEILCRVMAAGRQPDLRAINSDPRMLRLAALADDGLKPRGSSPEEGISVIWKRPEMVEGLGDLPWHRDCGMGGHAVMCPALVASVFLTPADEKTGALRVLPGSWNAACHFIDANHPSAPQGIVLEASPGDVSLHYTDTMHAAPPPAADSGAFRISAVTGYVRQGVRPHGGKRHYNDVLLGSEDGQVEHMSKLVD